MDLIQRLQNSRIGSTLLVHQFQSIHGSPGIVRLLELKDNKTLEMHTETNLAGDFEGIQMTNSGIQKITFDPSSGFPIMDTNKYSVCTAINRDDIMDYANYVNFNWKVQRSEQGIYIIGQSPYGSEDFGETFKYRI